MVKSTDTETREITTVYVGYLTGQIREILEASITNETQLVALKNVIADKIYEWWRGAEDPVHNETIVNTVKNIK